MIRAFLKDSVIYAIPALLSRGISIFLVPLYTRVLSAADYGSFDLLIAFSSFVSLVVALEISQAVARFYTGTEDKNYKVSYASSALWFTVFCYLVFSVVALAFSKPLSVFVMGRDGLVHIFQLGILYISLNAIFSLVQNQFRWELKGKNYAIASLLLSFSSALGAVVLAYFMKLGLFGLVWGLILGTMIGTLYGLWNLRTSYRLQFDMARVREMLVFSVPLVPAGLAVVASIYIDRIMISYLMTIDDVGLFGVGVRLASIVGLLMVGFQGALTPLVYTYHRNPETPAHLAKIFRYFSAFALLLCAGVSIFAKDILKFMTSPEYYSAATVVAFLAPAALLAQMYIFAPGIGIAKKTHLMIWINLSGLVVSVLLSWFLIPLYGIEGAGVSTLISYIFVFAAYMCSSQLYYPVPHSWFSILVSCLLCCVTVATVLWLDFLGWERWFFNVVSLALLLTAFIGLGLIKMEELVSAKMMLIKFYRKRVVGR